MLRAIYIGTLVADRDHYRASRPGMKVSDYHRIEGIQERAEYMELCKTLEKVCYSSDLLDVVAVF